MTGRNNFTPTPKTKVLCYIAAYVILIFLYILFLMVGELIPRVKVTDNAMESYNQLRKQGIYLGVIDGELTLDNWTDSYFINSAMTEYDGNLLQKAVANAYTTVTDFDDSNWADGIDNIRFGIEENEKTVVETYSRYWIGLLPIIRLLLIFMPIDSIRSIFFGIAIVLFAISVICVQKKLGLKGLIPYLISVEFAQYIPEAMCLVFSVDIIIMFLMMITCYIMLNKQVSAELFYIAFFLSGSILAYLNYWAFPLITLGFPLVFLVSARLIENYNIKTLTRETIFMSVSWMAGLVGTVLVKQILCMIILGTQSGTSQLLLRMGLSENITLRWRAGFVAYALIHNVLSGPVMILAVSTIVWLIIMFRSHRLKKQYPVLLLIMIAFYPVIWWFIFTKHCTHGFVKYMYGVSYYAMLSVFSLNCQSSNYI